MFSLLLTWAVRNPQNERNYESNFHTMDLILPPLFLYVYLILSLFRSNRNKQIQNKCVLELIEKLIHRCDYPIPLYFVII